LEDLYRKDSKLFETPTLPTKLAIPANYVIPSSAFVLSLLNLFLGTARSLFGESAYSSVPFIGASILDSVRYLENPVAVLVLYYLVARRMKFQISGPLILLVFIGGALGYLLGASLGIMAAGGNDILTFLASSSFGLISTGVDFVITFLAACAIAGRPLLNQAARN